MADNLSSIERPPVYLVSRRQTWLDRAISAGMDVSPILLTPDERGWYEDRVRELARPLSDDDRDRLIALIALGRTTAPLVEARDALGEVSASAAQQVDAILATVDEAQKSLRGELGLPW